MTTITPHGWCPVCGTLLMQDETPTSRDVFCPKCDWMPGDPVPSKGESAIRPNPEPPTVNGDRS